MHYWLLSSCKRLVLTVCWWCVIMGCQPSSESRPPTTADPELETLLAKAERTDTARNRTQDTASTVAERASLARELALSTPRTLADYVPILRDTLLKRDVPPALARQIARPLANRLKPDPYDIIDVLFEHQTDLNNDRLDDRLFTLRYGPFDGNGRGLLVLVLLSKGKDNYRAFATEAVWGREATDALPNLDEVQQIPSTGMPSFARNARQFAFAEIKP